MFDDDVVVWLRVLKGYDRVEEPCENSSEEAVVIVDDADFSETNNGGRKDVHALDAVVLHEVVVVLVFGIILVVVVLVAVAAKIAVAVAVAVAVVVEGEDNRDLMFMLGV